MPTIDIDLSAPLNLSFVNKKDRQGKFIQNSGIISEAGLHNAFEENGTGQYLGEFDENEIRSMVPVTTVIKYVEQPPDAFISRYGSQVDYDMRQIPSAIPEGLRRLDWYPSSGNSEKHYLLALDWIGTGKGFNCITWIFHSQIPTAQ